MHYLVRDYVKKSDDMTPAATVVLYVLDGYRNRNTGACYPSIREIALSCTLSESSVKRALRHLAKVGAIRIIKGTGYNAHNNYELLVGQKDTEKAPAPTASTSNVPAPSPADGADDMPPAPSPNKGRTYSDAAETLAKDFAALIERSGDRRWPLAFEKLMSRGTDEATIRRAMAKVEEHYEWVIRLQSTKVDNPPEMFSASINRILELKPVKNKGGKKVLGYLTDDYADVNRRADELRAQGIDPFAVN